MLLLPDYEGLGRAKWYEAHPYLNLKSEAFSITDAVVATRNYLASKVNRFQKTG